MCHEMLHRVVLPNVKVSHQEYQKGDGEQEEDQTKKKENMKGEKYIQIPTILVKG
jgi:hypothetical protein